MQPVNIRDSAVAPTHEAIGPHIIESPSISNMLPSGNFINTDGDGGLKTVIDIPDIARILSQHACATSHVEFYSKAQQAVELSMRVNANYAAHALLFNASDAYFYSPASILLDLKKVRRRIFNKFGLDELKPAELQIIHEAKASLAVQEAAIGRDDSVIEPLQPDQAYCAYLERYILVID